MACGPSSCTRTPPACSASDTSGGSMDFDDTPEEAAFRTAAHVSVREALAATYVRMQLLKFLGWRVQTAISRGEQPGPESSVLKLAYTRQLSKLGDLGLSVAGASGMLW